MTISQPELDALTRAKAKNSSHDFGETREGEEAAKRYAMFLLGAASFFAGFWAAACLISAMFAAGPLNMIKQLFTAVTGQ